MMYTTLSFLAIVSVVAAADPGRGNGGSRKKYSVIAQVIHPWLGLANVSGRNTGIIIDILEAIKAKDATFDYKLTQLTDGLYGDAFPNGTTTGMVNKVATGDADVAAGDFAILESRTSVLDFTVQIYQSQFRILVNAKSYNASRLSYIANTEFTRRFLAGGETKKVKAAWASAQANGVAAGNISAQVSAGVAQLLNSSSSLGFVDEATNLIFPYIANKDKLRLLPGTLGSESYAMAVKLGSNLRRKLNSAILKIEQSGLLQQILDHHIPAVCEK